MVMEPPKSENPYAAPAGFEAGVPSSGIGNFEVRGKRLLVRDGSTLPPRCIKTNDPVIPGESGRLKKVKLAWINQWWLLMIFVPFGIFILLIVSIFKTARGSITVSLSKRAIRKKRLTIIFWLGLTTFLVVFGISRMPTNSELGAFCLMGSMITLIITLFSIRYLATVNHKDGWFAVKGFHRDFLHDIERGKV